MLGAEARAEAGAGRERTPDLERFRLPLDLRGLELLVFERAFREPVGGFADRDSADRGDRLESRRRVHDVSGDDALAAVRSRVAIDHRFAGLDSNPHTQLEVGLGCVQLPDRIQDPESRPDRPLGVVLVGERRSEHCHHRIADEFLHRPPVTLEFLAQPLVVGADPRPYVLRVGGVRGGREADQVAEEHRDDLALLMDGRARPFSERSSAERAKGKVPGRQFLAARRAGRHRASLRTAWLANGRNIGAKGAPTG